MNASLLHIDDANDLIRVTRRDARTVGGDLGIRSPDEAKEIRLGDRATGLRGDRGREEKENEK